MLRVWGEFWHSARAGDCFWPITIFERRLFSYSIKARINALFAVSAHACAMFNRIVFSKIEPIALRVPAMLAGGRLNPVMVLTKFISPPILTHVFCLCSDWGAMRGHQENRRLKWVARGHHRAKRCRFADRWRLSPIIKWLCGAGVMMVHAC
ncbi:MAG: hypothetical protein AAFV87_05935 [Pseudomonadota bacterium]